MRVAGTGEVDARATSKKQIDERKQDAGRLRMDARRDQAERRAAALVHVRGSVNLGACVEKDLRDSYGILHRTLTPALDAVDADVVKQHRVMRPHRARLN